MVYQWLKKLQFQLFPSTCLLCTGAGGHQLDLCSSCHDELPWNRYGCQRCGAPLPTPDRFICGRCQHQPPDFTCTLAPLLYASPVDYLIQRLKFHGQLPTANVLAELLANALQGRDIPLPEAIIPVPLHPSRLAERGFNQALEIARPLARRLQRPLLTQAIYRTRSTPPQVALDAKKRPHNVRGAFAVDDRFQASHVAVVDDVVTTASTVAEVARVLKMAGVAKIEIWACARTPGDRLSSYNRFNE